MVRRKTHEEFVEELKEVQPELEVVGKYKTLRTKIIVKDKYGLLSTLPTRLLEGRYPSIQNATDKTRYWINQAKEVHENKYDYSLVEYNGSNSKLKIICPIHGKFEQTARSNIRGFGCRKCGREKANIKQILDIEDFINGARQVHGDKYDYSKVKYINIRTKVCIICSEHGEFWRTPFSHNQGWGCPKCRKKENLNKNKYNFIKKSIKIHGNRYDYSKIEYKNKNTEVCIICPEHGEFLQSPSSHLSGSGCPSCNSSKGELVIEKWIKNNKVYYKKEKKFDDCINKSYLPFDFYLPEYNICIEYDGEQHFAPIEYFGGEEKFKQRQQNDQIKNDYCKENNIKLIRIPYWDFDNIEEILEKEILK